MDILVNCCSNIPVKMRLCKLAAGRSRNLLRYVGIPATANKFNRSVSKTPPGLIDQMSIKFEADSLTLIHGVSTSIGWLRKHSKGPG